MFVVMSKNTLLNYFTRTPITNNSKKIGEDSKEESEAPKTPKSSKKKPSTANSTTPKQTGVNGKTPSQKTPTQNGNNVKTPKRSRSSLEQFSSTPSSSSRTGKDMI